MGGEEGSEMSGDEGGEMGGEGDEDGSLAAPDDETDG
jgi:hypothetical protein